MQGERLQGVGTTRAGILKDSIYATPMYEAARNIKIHATRLLNCLQAGGPLQEVVCRV